MDACFRSLAPSEQEKYLQRFYPKAYQRYAEGEYTTLFHRGYMDLSTDSALLEYLHEHGCFSRHHELRIGSRLQTAIPFTDECVRVEVEVPKERFQKGLEDYAGRTVHGYVAFAFDTVPREGEQARRTAIVALFKSTEDRNAWLRTDICMPAIGDDTPKFRQYSWHPVSGYKEDTWVLPTTPKETVHGYDHVFEEIRNDWEVMTQKRAHLESIGEHTNIKYLLYGEPGMGKTSFLTALATWLEKPLYIADMADVGGESRTVKAALFPQNDSWWRPRISTITSRAWTPARGPSC